ncbi:MAG: polysaccharide deacetylase family protein [Bacteroidales bacterium]|nr:polysaccharide deacetylase family protein [Bacteroidales bacterium]
MKNNEKLCILTNDVETTSILNHKLRDKTGEYILKQGMPRLLELYAKHNVKATFFFTGYIAKLYPEVVKMVQPYEHEIGSHGLTHRVDQAFDVLPLEKQIDHLKQSKAILEDISGEEVISFRAPAARINYNIPLALEEAGYKIDSSVSSQRLDMFFSFGSLKKLNWITAPRKPYYTANDNIFKKGNSSILEIPISAFGFPYIGTFMRIFPSLNRMTRNLLFFETKINNRPFVFLTHPNEFIDEETENREIERRGDNFLSYYLGDVLRHRMKVKNLGEKAIPIFEREIEFFERNQFNFITCKQFYELKKRVTNQSL